jgi:hypothetical protein
MHLNHLRVGDLQNKIKYIINQTIELQCSEPNSGICFADKEWATHNGKNKIN